MRVLRVYHGGRNAQHRARERALMATGVELVLVVPADWPEESFGDPLEEEFRIVELPVARPGDVNLHAFASPVALRRLIDDVRPDVLDVHEEPFSLASRQWLAATSLHIP